MKKFFAFFIVFFTLQSAFSQELLANVQINAQQIGGSNNQIFKTLEKNLRDFINNTSWTGKKLQNFEKIKSNFAIVVSERNGNSFKGSIVVQCVRPTYGSTYESPLMNLNDTSFGFEYTENENLIFNERQFSGKNLTDVISFYVYTILGYDADSFQVRGGQQWFDMARKISQNSQNQKYEGWSTVDGPKSRGSLINTILSENNSAIRNIFYTYHRTGLDNLSKIDQNVAKKSIADALLQLKFYENNFQMNYAINLFIDTKSDEIFKIFDASNNGGVNINDLRALMITFAPKYADTKWNKWK